jgi:hypothetical protein
MSDVSVYVIWSAIAILLALMDRFIMRRGRCQLLSVSGGGFKDGFYRVGISFNAYPPLMFSQVSYTLRDANHPTTVITGKTRTLEFSRRGLNSEFLLVKSELLTPGDWIVDVKIESIGCRINPFYKICPITSHQQRTVHVNKE